MMKKRLVFLFELLKNTVDRWSAVEGYRLGASFSFYATFSIFPLLLLAVTVVGFLIGDDAPARERLIAAIGAPGSVRDVLDRALTTMQENHGSRGASAAIAFFGLLFSASGAFVELDTALNRIWRVPPRRADGVLGSIRAFLLDRLSGFLIVAGIGLSLLVSLVTSSILTALIGEAGERVAIPWLPTILKAAELATSLAITTAVFTAAFHLIPRSHPPVRDVIGGAALTTALLTILKEIFATYLGRLTSYSAYGFVGGFLALATWIYLSSQVIFLGAQLTRVSAEMLGTARSDDELGASPA